MDAEYEGNVERDNKYVEIMIGTCLQATGEDYSVEPGESRRPFRSLLDVGLVRTTTGNRVFGVLKGALDGGIDIPHSEKRFAGFNKDSKQLDPEVHRKYIYGGHVASYMRTLMEDEPEKYQSHFSEYIKRGIEADNLEGVYKKVHAAIRANPEAKKSEKPPPKEHKRYNLKKLSYEERKAKLIDRLKALNSAAGVDSDEDDEDDKLVLFPAVPLVLGDCAFSYLVLLLYEHYWAFCYVIIFAVIAFLSNDFVLSHATVKNKWSPLGNTGRFSHSCGIQMIDESLVLMVKMVMVLPT
ncbi:hypothetical protein Goklo_007446 [Gossypium klotzschianum]|uniref:Large ribosomal subunit protein uL18 C-terminal eukaryotes domain-containing protein n=1 Tax=Gossypium klotzschianum TaxID=34286 RepID=A0A7J8W3M6_9ROSI|nr:hypothetical protein [Gossypium klotzschianum]